MIVLDTSGLLAWIDASQRSHSAVVASIKQIAAPYLLSPFVLAELDYLVATRVGSTAEHALLQEVENGAYHLVTFTAEDVGARPEGDGTIPRFSNWPGRRFDRRDC